LKIEELDLTPIIPKNDFVQIENEINQKGKPHLNKERKI